MQRLPTFTLHLPVYHFVTSAAVTEEKSHCNYTELHQITLKLICLFTSNKNSEQHYSICTNESISQNLPFSVCGSQLHRFLLKKNNLTPLEYIVSFFRTIRIIFICHFHLAYTGAKYHSPNIRCTFILKSILLKTQYTFKTRAAKC